MSDSTSYHGRQATMLETPAPAAPPVSEPARLGRPRDGNLDTVILEAALDLVAEVGYERVSMDAVAARAHSSKATIYRRWSSKAALVAAAIECRTSVDLDMPETGSLRGDLIAALTSMSAAMMTHDLGLLTGLFAAMRSDSELADAIRSCMFEDKNVAVNRLFERAKGYGTAVHPDATLLFHEVAPAVVIHRLMVDGHDIDQTFIEHVVDDVLLRILTLPLHAQTL